MRNRMGITFVEVLVVVAILVIFVGAMMPRDVGQLARDTASVARFVVSRRLIAVASGRATSAVGQSCAFTIGAKLLPPVALVTVPPRGLLFTPDGLPRTCDGGGVGNTTILLEHRGRQAAVIVSSLGRVRWELR